MQFAKATGRRRLSTTKIGRTEQLDMAALCNASNLQSPCEHFVIASRRGCKADRQADARTSENSSGAPAPTGKK
jgi:hypothetical protein